ncbi:SulP family inorganic anion transporter [Arthrobacter sp. SDTb3-6]|uniref:SulP family inorganic anion transporter n=1 Tax=Arthrobacter sp. SDTb3-6 TaxID=2713571 RepID=UPI00159D2DC0|nr:SulP family inorganic anion transporter [Arthrobacter sp. SDTb3-6]
MPLDLATHQLIWPTALSVAFVGLRETLLTSKPVDEITYTRSHKGQESWALGVSNILSGFYGGMAGCAMIGQPVPKVTTGQARTRIFTFVAGVFLLDPVTGLSEVTGQIPMAALAMVLFARRVAHVISVDRTLADDGAKVRYAVVGPLFFGSSNDLVDQFAYADDPAVVDIDLSRAQIWDASTVAAPHSVETKYRDHGATVTITGLDGHSAGFHRRLTGQLNT